MSRADLVRFPLLEAGQPYPLGATVTEGASTSRCSRRMRHA